MAVSKKAGSTGRRAQKQGAAANAAQPAQEPPEKKRIVNARKSIPALLFFIILAAILFFAFRGEPAQDIDRMIEAGREDLAVGRYPDAIRHLDIAINAIEDLRRKYGAAEPESRIHALIGLQREANELRKAAELK
ncbi:MAG: hypothetical protein LBC99_10945 [Spirochaetota bacterium]|jgi:hypothetical protein|nr:hypothetical protein [Spirochaetota bacterium]